MADYVASYYFIHPSAPSVRNLGIVLSQRIFERNKFKPKLFCHHTIQHTTFMRAQSAFKNIAIAFHRDY